MLWCYGQGPRLPSQKPSGSNDYIWLEETGILVGGAVSEAEIFEAHNHLSPVPQGFGSSGYVKGTFCLPHALIAVAATAAMSARTLLCHSLNRPRDLLPPDGFSFLDLGCARGLRPLVANLRARVSSK